MREFHTSKRSNADPLEFGRVGYRRSHQARSGPLTPVSRAARPVYSAMNGFAA